MEKIAVSTIQNHKSKSKKMSSFGGVFNIIKKEKVKMEELLTKIGELVATEMEEVKDVKYVDKQMVYMFYIVLNDNRRVLLSLIESTNNE